MPSRIRITRKPGALDRLRSYRVRIDHRYVGKIRPGATEEFEVVPGRHVVELALDWTASAPVSVDVAPEGCASLRCTSQDRALRGAYMAFFKRREYLQLQAD